MERQALLVRYETLAANRRHFEKLLFAVICFSWSFGLAVWVAIAALFPTAAGLALAAAGALLLSGAFIAYRLMLRGQSAFDAMAGSWRAIAGEKERNSSGRSKPGAMIIAVTGQALAGLMCIASGVMSLG